MLQKKGMFGGQYRNAKQKVHYSGIFKQSTNQIVSSIKMWSKTNFIVFNAVTLHFSCLNDDKSNECVTITSTIKSKLSSLQSIIQAPQDMKKNHYWYQEDWSLNWTLPSACLINHHYHHVTISIGEISKCDEDQISLYKKNCGFISVRQHVLWIEDDIRTTLWVLSQVCLDCLYDTS